jgi:ribosomal protein S15P/S13E
MKLRKRTQRLTAHIKHHEWQALSRKGRRAIIQMCRAAADFHYQQTTYELTSH